LRLTKWRKGVLMAILKSAGPSPELRPYVRAYAYRKFEATDLAIVEPVPAQLEQVLNFELGVMPGVCHRNQEVSARVWIGGAQTSFPGYMKLYPGVESFAIFFQPAGWSQLFAIPMREFTNRLHDATSVIGQCMRDLWNRLGESSSFDHKVGIAEEFLLRRALTAKSPGRIAVAATYLFRHHGAVDIAKLARREAVGLRQFERRFQEETGAAPKLFARVARFQAAVDAKLASPRRTWLDIAHSFGYYDQMHMIHDFERLGGDTPRQLLAQMGDVRPPALAAAGK
jgi:AraC-like DNA-binding protein